MRGERECGSWWDAWMDGKVGAVDAFFGFLDGTCPNEELDEDEDKDETRA